MKSFLSQTLEEILNKYPAVDGCTFVLPSQRACVFLKEELIQNSSSSQFLPKIVSIENFIQELAGIKQLDQVQLLFEFYGIYKRLTKNDRLDAFDVFSQWATIALYDFNEVDRHLVDPKQIFAYLKDIGRLKEWDVSKDEIQPTDIMKNHFSFMENLGMYYEGLYEYLVRKKVGYQGLIYREAENNIQHFIENYQGTKIFLIGFNALNKAEENIFQELLENELAEIYWDCDEYYMNTNKEAGNFLRKYKNEWPYFTKHTFKNVVSNFEKEKKIELIGAPKNVTQIKYIGEILQQQDNYSNTALVLADEGLLSLTLNSLPQKVDKINITMGYPLKDIPVASLFELVFKMRLNKEKFENNKAVPFYYKDVVSFFNHQEVRKLMVFEEQNVSDIITTQIIKNNHTFVGFETFTGFLNSSQKELLFSVAPFFKEEIDVSSLIRYCIDLIERLNDFSEGIEKEYLYRFYTIFSQLNNLNNKFGYISNIKVLYQFYKQLLNSEKLSFQGEPLKGLQLMGMLETRVLDFETVIISSVNEGVLPSGKNENSFIPFDVKLEFNLPTYKEKDTVFSYHFYRLLQRAKNIYLTYNTEPDAFGSGEKSRFLTQMEIEDGSIAHKLVSPKVEKNSSSGQEIEKTPDVLLEIQEYAQKGISPSALANYVYNPIDFYYQKILKIKEADEMEETVAVNTMGTVVHDSLEEMYKPFEGKFVQIEDVKEMQKNTSSLIAKYFKKHYKNGDISKGKNKLIFEVAKCFVDKFLRLELKDLEEGRQLKIIATELPLEASLNIEGIEFPVKIKGIVDRVDEVDGVTRIIDYKTGKVEGRQLKINDFGLIREDYKHTKALQVMLYTYLFQVNHKFDLTKPLESGIISFKNLKNKFLKMNFAEGRKKSNTVSQEHLDDFMVALKQLIAEICDASVPFKENENRPF